MKIETKITKEGHSLIISEAYSGLTIKTREGKELNICLRDWGFDMNINGGKWHSVSDDNDFAKESIVQSGSGKEQVEAQKKDPKTFEEIN